MKIFRSEQIRNIDTETIKREPILSIDLMERAAEQLFRFIKEKNKSEVSFSIFSGIGNNGGDAVAVARMLHNEGFKVDLYFLAIGNNISKDCQTNIDRFNNLEGTQFVALQKGDKIPNIPINNVIIDGIFGSGLTRPVKGWPAQIINTINSLPNKCISIDIPSGLFSEDNRENKGAIINADYSVSFEFPKIAFLLADNAKYVGEWETRSINLLPAAIEETQTDYYYTTIDNLPKLNKRGRFVHKGNFGHTLLVAGSYGKTGAAVLAAKACVRSGSGLLSVHVPESSYEIIQISVPEAMVVIDNSEQTYCNPQELDTYTIVGIGPGIGQKKPMQKGLQKLIEHISAPMVFDADAINILSKHKKWMRKIPQNSILTPHPKEFDRLAGVHQTHYDRLMSAQLFATKHKIIIVLKGAYTAVVNTNGNVFFNSSGNPSMAKGGSGDVLTGIILGLLSSGYSPINAARLGVFIHGKAADLALEQHSIESILATDIIEYLGKAFNFVKECKPKE